LHHPADIKRDNTQPLTILYHQIDIQAFTREVQTAEIDRRVSNARIKTILNKKRSFSRYFSIASIISAVQRDITPELEEINSASELSFNPRAVKVLC